MTAILAVALIVHSCRKENKHDSPSMPEIAAAKAWYENTYPANGSTSGKLLTQSAGEHHDLSQWIKPDWQHVEMYTRLGKSVIELPIEPSAKFGLTLQFGTRRVDPIYSRSYFLLINDGQKYNAYVLTIIADSSYVNNDVSKLTHNTYRKHDPDFSGSVLYFTPTGAYLGGYAYKNGQIITPTTDAGTDAVQKVQSISSGKLTPNTMVQVCTDWYIAYFTDGVFQYATYLTTTCKSVDDGNTTPGGGNGGSPPPPPPPCPPGSHTGPPVVHPCTVQAVESINDGLKINNIPAPPPDGMPPPPSQTPCVVDAPAKPCPPDPCAQAKALALDAKFKSEMADLQSKTGLAKEVGYMINADGTYTYKEGVDGQAYIDLNPTTPLAGFLHSHYGGTDNFPTFSGTDVKAIYDLQQLGKVADISKFTAAVVTPTGSYIMKINDPTKFAAFAATNFSTAAKFQNFQYYYLNSQAANQHVLGKDFVTSYELALLTVLKDSGITLLKGNSTFTTWNTESNTGNAIVVTTCN
ncbi:hypothetical protein [Mucilaginibacter sp.]|uniref:hypothetical protein n=1 Tax=Mucilaginibacter sp. TaxID=1882438 RepID=UPI0025E0F56C|nr:hypothetical protein [Mucilaginibacter sp.]